MARKAKPQPLYILHWKDHSFGHYKVFEDYNDAVRYMRRTQGEGDEGTVLYILRHRVASLCMVDGIVFADRRVYKRHLERRAP